MLMLKRRVKLTMNGADTARGRASRAPVLTGVTGVVPRDQHLLIVCPVKLSQSDGL